MTALTNIFDQSIPNGRQSLSDCFSNLERVAAYCEANYLQMPVREVLQDTKRFAVQSLASVAYQVNKLATDFLNAIDLQCEKISQLDKAVNLQAQEVAIYKEKIARREIGVLTTSRCLPRFHQVVPPAQPMKEKRYVRTPIEYFRLDNIGHGLKTAHQTSSVVSIGHNTSTGSSYSSTSNYMSFPINNNYSMFSAAKANSISKSTGKEYRTPVTIAPPTAPEVDRLQVSYRGMVQIGQAIGNESSYYVPSGINGNQYMGDYGHHGVFEDSSTIVNPANVSLSSGLHRKSNSSEDALAPSLPENMLFAVGPPSPSVMFEGVDCSTVHLRRNHSMISHADDWVPVNYLEKVTAMYDYVAEKPDELSFSRNAIIYVLRKNEDGWYEGVMDGVTGLFPGNYVEECM